MKRLMAILLAMMLACVCIPAMAEIVEADVSGEWYLTALTAGEMSINAATMGIDMSMTLNDDGTVVLRSASSGEEEARDGSWEIQNGALLLTVEDETITLTLEDGNLKGEMSDSGVVFSREKPEAVVPPQVIEAESEDVFLGTWNVSLINMDGSLFPVELLAGSGMDLTATLNIQPGTAGFQLTFLMELPEITGTTALEDGKLVMTVEGLDDPIIIQATDTGALYMEFTISEMDMSLPMYFEKAE